MGSTDLPSKLSCFVITILCFHVVFFFTGTYSFSSSPSVNKLSVTSSSKCPYTATKAFVTRQASLLSNALSSLQMVSMLPNADLLMSLSDSPIKSGGALFANYQRRLNTRSRQPTCLFATTTDEPKVDAIVKEKSKKKKSAEALEVIVLGLSHHNAKVEIREKLAIPEAEWNDVALKLTETESIQEAAILSTCNRFEMYIAGQNQYECMKDAIDFLLERAGGSLDQATLRKSLFMLSGEDAIWHILRVSAGLDSLIVGEGQILAQVKRAYERGIEPESGQGGKVLSRMLNTAVTAGKRVRSETGISKGAVSVSSAAAEFTAMKIKEDCNIERGMEGANVAIIGAGKMARLLLVHLQTQGVSKVTVVNRSPERVHELEKEFPDMKIELQLMDKMWDVIAQSDVVYPSTASTTTIIDAEPLRDCMSRRQRPGGIQFVDISVPRNVHPDCGNIANVHSYNVDDLKAVVERNTAKRRREMVEAENILRDELSKFRLWQLSLGAIPTIAKLQEKAESLRLEEFQKATKKLANLSAKDLEAVDRLSKGIVAKLLHGPMQHLRQQKEGDATRAAIEQVQQAFQLEQ